MKKSCLYKIFVFLLLAAFVLSFGAVALAEGEEPAPEQTEDLLGLPEAPAEDPSAEGIPVSDEIPELPEESAEPEQPETFGNLSPSLLEMAAEELSNLSEQQRQEIIRIWTENDFHFSGVTELMTKYGGLGLSDETAFIILLANADACVRYVAESYGGNRTTLKEFSQSFLGLTEELGRSGFDLSGKDNLRVLALVGVAYQAMLGAGNEGEERDGLNYTNALVLAYGADKGEQDANEFLGMFVAADVPAANSSVADGSAADIPTADVSAAAEG